MGKFDKYISRFDELEGKKGKGPVAPEGATKARNRRRIAAGLGVVIVLLIVSGVVYGPRLAGAAAPADEPTVDPAAQRDREMLRGMTLEQVKAEAKKRVALRDQLKKRGAPKTELSAADDAAWRANAVAWDKTPH